MIKHRFTIVTFVFSVLWQRICGILEELFELFGPKSAKKAWNNFWRFDEEHGQFFKKLKHLGSDNWDFL